MLVVVGGHSRNIGKTSVVTGLIRSLPKARWTAMKITQHGHGICSEAGQPCHCAIEYDHPYAISEETEANASDSGRFLGAGALRAFWLRTPVGQLGHALPEIRRVLAQTENAILESNSVLDFLRPELYLVVLDFSVADMKDSSRRFFPLADAFVIVESGVASPPWAGIPPRWLADKPHFRVRQPEYVTPGLAEFVGRRLAAQVASGKATSKQTAPPGPE